jgi:enterochelin esterase-like enzyme
VNLTHFPGKRHRAANGLQARIRIAIAAIAGLVAGLSDSPGLAAGAAQGLQADAGPVAIVRAYFAAGTREARADAAARLAAHADFAPGRLAEWLHAAASYPALSPGTHTLSIDIAAGDTRELTLILPDGYRADRPWPLIYALHPSGESGAEWAVNVRTMLATLAPEYVIAAPHNYRQNYIATGPPFTPEHPAILDTLTRRVHMAADRVYVFGYSKGAFGAWFNALYYPDRFAGAVAFAGGFDVAIDNGGLWKALVANITHVPVYNAWGERDTLVARGIDNTPDGTFVEQNRRFVTAITGMKLPIVNIEVPDGVHNALSPPGRPMGELLRMRRVTEPKRLTHTFRHLHQASCYWLEGLGWAGDGWGDATPAALPALPGEQPRDTLARTLETYLARLTGEIDGQHVRVTRRHIGDLVVWFGEKTVDWSKPVTVEVDGRIVFEGRLRKNAAIALARAAMTRDFTRLRWAGLRVDASGAARPVTADDVPEPVWQRR